MRLRDRIQTTGDLLVAMIAGTVCVVVMITSLALIVQGFFQPEVDHSAAAIQINDIISTLIGLLAGYLGGKAESVIRKRNGDATEGPPGP